MLNFYAEAFNIIYFTQLDNPSKHMFNVWRLRIALQWVWCYLLLDQANQPPQPDRQHRNLVTINVTIIIMWLWWPHHDVHGAEAEGDPGQGGGPGLQPPGHRLRAPVPVPVAWTHKEKIFTVRLKIFAIVNSIVCHLTRGVCSWRALTSSHWCSPGWILVKTIRGILNQRFLLSRLLNE